jgi:hypothetical protein
LANCWVWLRRLAAFYIEKEKPVPKEAIYCALLSGIAAAIICQIFFWVFKPWLNRVSNLPSRGLGGVPGYVTGFIESFAFGVVAAVAPSDAGFAGLAWLALKLLPDWQLVSSIADPTVREQHGNYRFKGLVMGLTNLVLAAGIGYVAFLFCLRGLR